jgi:hypothetical protein
LKKSPVLFFHYYFIILNAGHIGAGECNNSKRFSGVLAHSPAGRVTPCRDRIAVP